MPQEMKHRALQPYLNDLKNLLTLEGSDYEVWGDTLKLESREAHEPETTLSDERVNAIATKGYELLKVRVFMGQGPNYTDHTFPLASQNKTQVPQTGGLGSISGMPGFGGLAGIGGDGLSALTAELDFRETRKDNERLKKENEELRKKYKSVKRHAKELDEKLQSLPMYKMGGIALSGTVAGLLNSPQFASSPLAGLLAPSETSAPALSQHDEGTPANFTLHEDTQELNGTEYSPQILNAAKGLTEMFQEPNEQTLVMDIIAGLAIRKDILPSVHAHIKKHVPAA